MYKVTYLGHIMKKIFTSVENIWSEVTLIFDRVWEQHVYRIVIQSDTKKWELLKNPTKIEEIKKKIIDRN